jgi:hypothetical protein
VVVLIYNPSYSGGGDRRTVPGKPGKSLSETLSEKQNKKAKRPEAWLSVVLC